MYAFVGKAGMAKMCSSKGGVPGPSLTDAVEDTPELRAAQRSYFALLYRLLVGGETGPRLPKLLLAISAGRVRELLALPDK